MMLTLTARKGSNDRLLPITLDAHEAGSQLKKLQKTRRSYSLDNSRTALQSLAKSHIALEENVPNALLTGFQKKDHFVHPMRTHWSFPSFTNYRCSEASESLCEVRFELLDDVASSSSSDVLPSCDPVVAPPRSTLRKFVVTGKQCSSNQLWKTKRLSAWSSEDIYHWLQHVNLDASLPGSEFIGKDLENWNDEVLTELGVRDSRIRELLLEELNKVRGRCARRQSIRPRALFPLLADQRYEIVKALSLPPKVTLDKLDVTEQPNGGLTVLNGACCVGMTKQYFHSLLTRTRGRSRKLVILRKRSQQVFGEVSRLCIIFLIPFSPDQELFFSILDGDFYV
ncbi:hypothetical protein TTRE_0000579401 [Trichuris trichiura]|uniref:SAM domain-containing protein n=1 Tax=Trichuris trichiura TaxID=36087 RepID=A0A077ZAW2_TRITR|nr:hypothetical protein TTRE_0000579401 [Trichuris trichiura]